MSLLMPVPSYPDYYNFVVSFEINCESFFKSVLTILSVLHFPYECWNQLVIFCRKDSWDFERDLHIRHHLLFTLLDEPRLHM